MGAKRSGNFDDAMDSEGGGKQRKRQSTWEGAIAQRCQSLGIGNSLCHCASNTTTHLACMNLSLASLAQVSLTPFSVHCVKLMSAKYQGPRHFPSARILSHFNHFYFRSNTWRKRCRRSTTTPCCLPSCDEPMPSRDELMANNKCTPGCQ
jgi:hypothetical protein